MDYSSTRQSRPSSSIPLHRTQLHPRLIHTDPPPKPHNPNKSLLLLSSILTLPFLFYLLSTASKIHSSTKFQSPKPTSYHILIHSKPTCTTLRIFQFLNEGLVPFINLNNGSDLNSFKINHFSYSANNLEALVSNKLVEFAKDRVPQSEWGNSKVQVLIGKVELEKLGEKERSVVLGSWRRVLKASGFLFRDDWVHVIEAQEEGIYAWVAANYALGTLGGEPLTTTGIVELGGASMQVVFAPKEQPPTKFLRILKLAGITYNLYSQSFPQFGQDAAWESLDELPSSKDLNSHSISTTRFRANPCISGSHELPINASDTKVLPLYPPGNFSACRSEAVNLLKRRLDKCLYPPCKIVSSVFIELRGNPVPPEYFYYTSELFGIVPKASLSEVEMAGQRYCEDDLDKLERSWQNSDQLELSRYCFSSAYTVALLHDILGIPMDDIRIGFARHSLSSIPLDWTLGAFILQTMLDPLETESENIEQFVGNDSITFFLLFAILLVIVLVAFFVLRWRKPQLKTIYDLEKGRYIVTRIPQ